MNDDPTTYDRPVVTAPRHLRVAEARRGSVALAVVGEMLDDAEYLEEAGGWPLVNRVVLLREVRDRIAKADR